MQLAVQRLSVSPDHLLIDAMKIAHPCAQTKLFYGDALSVSIAAASVVAKVHRDALMRELDLVHPQYGLAAHKGYGTAEHRRALAEHGPCALHRRSFGPVAKSEREAVLDARMDAGEMLFDDAAPEGVTLQEDAGWV